MICTACIPSLSVRYSIVAYLHPFLCPCFVQLFAYADFPTVCTFPMCPCKGEQGLLLRVNQLGLMTRICGVQNGNENFVLGVVGI